MQVKVTPALPDWASLQDEDWPNLLVGNGLGINLWDGFRYRSLFKKANLTAPAKAIFRALSTHNFEDALECLHHARIANKALGKSTRRVDKTYKAVRDALFAAVNRAHVPWGKFPDPKHTAIAQAVAQHRDVFTTNYDLCLYWSLLRGEPPVATKDFFWGRPDNRFDPANISTPLDVTRVYYLHGALHLWQSDAEDSAGKWTSDTGNLLDLKGRYMPVSDKRPLFVSEGDWHAKERTIRRSTYLSFCLDSLRSTPGDIVVFGQSLSVQDSHIVNALNRASDRRVAVSIFPSTKPRDVVAEKARILKALDKQDVVFFDSTTHPLGDPSLHIRP